MMPPDDPRSRVTAAMQNAMFGAPMGGVPATPGPQSPTLSNDAISFLGVPQAPPVAMALAPVMSSIANAMLAHHAMVSMQQAQEQEDADAGLGIGDNGGMGDGGASGASAW